MTTPPPSPEYPFDDMSRFGAELREMIAASPTPGPLTDAERDARWRGANPWNGPDPQGDAVVELPHGKVSTPQSRAAVRRRLSDEFERCREQHLHPTRGITRGVA